MAEIPMNQRTVNILRLAKILEENYVKRERQKLTADLERVLNGRKLVITFP